MMGDISYILFLEMGSLMKSSSSAGPIQISEFPEPWFSWRNKKNISTFKLEKSTLSGTMGKELRWQNNLGM